MFEELEFLSWSSETFPVLGGPTRRSWYTDKKDNKIFVIYKEIQMVSGAKSYMRKGFLIYEEINTFFTIYEEVFSHI
jgi:hypothetical protein